MRRLLLDSVMKLNGVSWFSTVHSPLCSSIQLIRWRCTNKYQTSYIYPVNTIETYQINISCIYPVNTMETYRKMNNSWLRDKAAAARRYLSNAFNGR